MLLALRFNDGLGSTLQAGLVSLDLWLQRLSPG